MLDHPFLIFFSAGLLSVVAALPAPAQTEPPVPRAIPVQEPEAPAIAVPQAEPVGEPEAPAVAVPQAEPVGEAPRAEPVEETVRPGYDGLPLNPDLPVGLRILSPGSREVLPEGTLDLFLSLQNYALGDPERGGNRIHVILDNRPPLQVYDIDRPVTFTNLASGGHTLRAFACRPDGTAIRDESAHAICHFFVGKKDFQNYVDPRAPYLTLNLPAGGEVDSTVEGMIIFDYIVHHPDDARGYRVRYNLTGGYTGELEEQGPVYWNNLTPGRHRLFVEFLDSRGKLIPGPFNQIEREFVVRKVIRAQPVTPDDGAAPGEAPPEPGDEVAPESG